MLNLEDSKMKPFALALVCGAALSASMCHAQKLVYLSCDAVSSDGKYPMHFDFTLDEQNGTVSYFVKAANALNKPQAVFGADKVTWSEDDRYVKRTRSINRVTLVFTQDDILSLTGALFHSEGQCSLKTPPERKF